MVRIRFSRVGRHGRVLFRLVACNKQSPRDGKNLEILGTYDPIAEDAKRFTFNSDRVKHWLREGAQPTNTVWSFLRKNGINKANFRDAAVAQA